MTSQTSSVHSRRTQPVDDKRENKQYEQYAQELPFQKILITGHNLFNSRKICYDLQLAAS